MSDSTDYSVSMFLATDSITEVRALNCWDNNPEYKSTRIGYFDDAALAAKAVEELEIKWHPEGIYITLNPVRRDLLSRSANRIQKAKKNEATSDGDIRSRRWLLIDFDPVRPAGISATDSELYEAEEAARNCVVWLQEQGWPEPFVMLSGNGYHVLYRIDLPADDGGLIKRCLAALSARFSTDNVHLDKKVFNAARITKLYGSRACKGDPTVDRPHRRSGLMEYPLVVQVVPVELLERLAGPVALPRSSSRSASNDDDRLNVEKWLSRHGVGIIDRDQTSDGTDRWLIPCPRESAHTSPSKTTDCCVTQSPSGELGGHCFHDSCGMADWQSLKAAIGPLEYEDYHDIPDTSSVDLSCLMTVSRPADLIQHPFPESCLRPPGLLSDIIDWNLKTALYPLPKLALAGAMALMSTITGRTVTDRFGTRTNCYIVGMAPSGSGKEHARKINKDLMLAARGEKMLGPERIGSSAGLTSWVQANPVILFQLDEIGKLMQTMANPAKAPHLFNIGAVLMQLYSASNSTWIGDAYADKKKTPTIHQPHAVVYGTTTPDQFWESLTADSVSDGFLGRLIAIEDEDGDFRSDIDHAQPPWLIDKLRWWIGLGTEDNLIARDNPTPRLAAHSEEAFLRYTQHLEAIRKRRKDDAPITSALWARSGGKAGKIALLFACSRCTGQEVRIEIEDVDRAILLSNWLTRKLIYHVGERVSGSITEDLRKRFLRVFNGEELTAHQLSRKTPWLNKKGRRDVVEDCLDRGEIEERRESAIETGGRPCSVFRRVSSS